MVKMKLHLLPKDQIWRIFPERDFTDEEIEDFKRMKIEAYNEARVKRIKELIEEEKEEELKKKQY